jgi:hypothetical protein
MSRVIRRPIGGWHARTWRREVGQWLLFAAFVVGSWVGLNLFAGVVDVVAERFSLRQTVTPHDFQPPRNRGIAGTG